MTLVSENLLFSIERQVEEHLSRHGYRQVKRQYQVQFMGNLYSVYESQEGVVRLIWDGRQDRLTLRVYRKRPWSMKLVKALMGRNDDEKLAGETVIPGHELHTLKEEQIVERCLQKIDSLH
ncbi:hypothetical protein [Cohnella sp. AR92]|uniref:hypothetical protein n=1 Tax=Cohnella sp. AR92 TaxID=648716 RepID=UPI000F8D89AF|nr:hypothetical protein [Cohnella sp. AR92]RUS45816.1 hypothetical protein ELR57_18350 [Cohnella sp. AR92]